VECCRAQVRLSPWRRSIHIEHLTRNGYNNEHVGCRTDGADGGFNLFVIAIEMFSDHLNQ
jgi:hypothetical protein